MLAIKEISGVSPVERKWLETWKRTEDGGGPFPPVAQHVVNAESALTFGKCIDRRRIPTAKVKIAEPLIQLRIGRFIAPRISSCVSVDGAIGGVLPLGFGGERLPCPARVRTCFRLTHIHGPVQRRFVERYLVEHRPVKPSIVVLLPEQRMRNSTSSLPVPVIVVPESASLIAARRHKLEILPVCHLILIDFKRRDCHLVNFILVVPAKVLSISRETECCDAGGHVDHPVCDRRTSEIQ